MEFIVPIVIVVLAVALLTQALKVVRQQQVGIVERLGKFRRTLDPGPHLLVPLIDNVRYTMTCARPSCRSRRRA